MLSMTPTRVFVLLLLCLGACTAEPTMSAVAPVAPAAGRSATAGAPVSTGGVTAPIAPIAGRTGSTGGAGSSAGMSGGVGAATAGGGASGAAGAGTGGSAGGAAARTYAPTFSAIYSEIFENSNYNCNLGACHLGSSMMVAGDAATTYKNIIDVVASGADQPMLPGCGSSGLKLIVPNKPNESLLLLKVKEAPPCGSRMRLNGPFLEARDIEQITKWIEMGALNN
jgi:hypothetical protein